MSNNSPNNSESNKNNIMKFMINCLHGQIETMKQEIAFLRTDSKCKNSTIDHLFNQIPFLRENHRSPPPISDLSELMKNLTLQPTTSVENDSVSSYNTEINKSINK